MKKEYRLLKNQDFKSVLDYKRCVSRETVAIYHKTNNVKHCRVGVSVSSKIGNSVIRHKIKRQVNSMLDKCVPVDNEIDIVVIVRKKYTANTYNDNFNIIEGCIREILKRRNKNEKEK